MSSVSIVIPARNAAATLSAAIASVTHQTHTDWEVIVIDDGSTDSTAANARAWCDRDPRIRLITGRKRGASAARNEAARHAAKTWLLFLDADDLILPTHLATMLAAASQSTDLIYCGGAKMASDGRIGQAEIPPQKDHFKLLASRNLFHIHACLVRRATFEKFGGFDEELKSCEEWDLWQRLARGGAVFARVEEPLTLYRLRAHSLSHEAEVLFENACKVITRGHGRDPRVSHPLPAFAEGEPAQEAPLAIIAFAAWCAGMLIGAGKNAESFLQRVELPRTADIETDSVVSMMQAGVPMGACTVYEDWPTLWPLHKSSIERVFAVLQERCAIPDLAARCIAEFEVRLRYEFEPRQTVETAGTSTGPGIVASARRAAGNSTPPILLMYHRINRLSCDPWNLCVSPENFSQQIALLEQQRDIVPLSWLVEKLERGHVPSRTAVLTFDDGYADVLFHAKPILEKRGCPATFFLATGPISGRNGFWWDILARIILETEPLPQEFTLEVRGKTYSWRLKLGDQENEESSSLSPSELYFALWSLVKPLSPDERQAIISRVAAWAGTHADELERDRILIPNEVRELSEPAFIDIGAHTVTHPSLPSLSSAEQRWEIEESRVICEELASSPVSGFAYPFGDFDDDSCSQVSAAGFKFACTTKEHSILPAQDLMRLPRLYVGDWNAAEFEAKILRRQ
jgi:peptidoglycan/xylan/chitin deacetylase (PgdA/CDA1 family)